jgi:hypothetical protein
LERVGAIAGAPPPALEARPVLLPGLGRYVEAFDRLSSARGAGFGGPNPIPLSEIESYCRLFGWRDPEEIGELVELIQAMDEAYLEVSTRLREAGRRHPAGRQGAAARCGEVV